MPTDSTRIVWRALVAGLVVAGVDGQRQPKLPTGRPPDRDARCVPRPTTFRRPE